jgi:hypothetical protein
MSKSYSVPRVRKTVRPKNPSRSLPTTSPEYAHRVERFDEVILERAGYQDEH